MADGRGSEEHFFRSDVWVFFSFGGHAHEVVLRTLIKSGHANRTVPTIPFLSHPQMLGLGVSKVDPVISPSQSSRSTRIVSRSHLHTVYMVLHPPTATESSLCFRLPFPAVGYLLAPDPKALTPGRIPSKSNSKIPSHPPFDRSPEALSSSTQAR